MCVREKEIKSWATENAGEIYERVKERTRREIQRVNEDKVKERRERERREGERGESGRGRRETHREKRECHIERGRREPQ